MQKLTVPKAKLLATLTTNRNTHREQFLEAQKGYRKAIIEALDERLTVAQDGKIPSLRFNLVEPQDMTAEYDRVISMVEWEVEDSITLDQESFKNFVLDDWSWSHHVNVANTSYLS